MWTDEMFGVKKPIIALLHLDPLPGDPAYCGCMEQVFEHAHEDLMALQAGGVDGVLVANEFSMPYSAETEYSTVAAMAYLVGRLKNEFKVPYGVNIILNGAAAIDLASATGAKFVRSAFTGAYMGEYGVNLPNNRKAVRRKYELGLKDLKLFYKVNPESDRYLVDRDIETVTKAIVFQTNVDALCVSGASSGGETSSELLAKVKKAAGEVPIFCNTGVTIDNVKDKMKIADGACIGTSFKENGKFWYTRVDVERVKAFMDVMKEIRASL